MQASGLPRYHYQSYHSDVAVFAWEFCSNFPLHSSVLTLWAGTVQFPCSHGEAVGSKANFGCIAVFRVLGSRCRVFTCSLEICWKYLPRWGFLEFELGVVQSSLFTLDCCTSFQHTTVVGILRSHSNGFALAREECLLPTAAKKMWVV